MLQNLNLVSLVVLKYNKQTILQKPENIITWCRLKRLLLVIRQSQYG